MSPWSQAAPPKKPRAATHRESRRAAKRQATNPSNPAAPSSAQVPPSDASRGAQQSDKPRTLATRQHPQQFKCRHPTRVAARSKATSQEPSQPGGTLSSSSAAIRRESRREGAETSSGTQRRLSKRSEGRGSRKVPAAVRRYGEDNRPTRRAPQQLAEPPCQAASSGGCELSGRATPGTSERSTRPMCFSSASSITTLSPSTSWVEPWGGTVWRCSKRRPPRET